MRFLDVLGAVGGLAGLAALLLTLADRRSRRVVQSLPNEAVELLRSIIQVTAEIQRRERSWDWIQERVAPLASEFSKVQEVVSRVAGGSAERDVRTHVSLLDGELDILVNGRAEGDGWSKALPSTWGIDQREHAKTATAAAVSILKQLQRAGIR